MASRCPTEMSMSIYIIVFLWICAGVGGVAGKDCTQTIPKVCDYIIVGAGAAGATLAGRLSEVKHITVCLFEAGTKDADIPLAATSKTPRLLVRFAFSNPLSWNYTTVPQKGLKNRALSIVMGKVLGGSTTTNGMLYARGFKADYDFWAANGATGWSYDDVFPFFLKSENNISPLLKDSALHSRCGPLTISQRMDFINTPLHKLFTDTANELRIPMVDCGEPSPFGLCLDQTTIKAGIRQSTSVAYLRPNLGRPNLFVITEALVEKILINKRNQAYGIRVFHKGETFSVRARHEVIISAGSIESPKLLQLSGIGPKSVLKKFKIPLHANLPVGRNYHDQLVQRLSIFIDVPTVTPEILNDPRTLLEYISDRKGLYAHGAVALLLFTDLLRQHQFNRPELETEFLDGIPTASRRNGTLAVNILLHPKSRGTIKIRSRNPHDQPLIDPNVFQDQSDFRTMLKGLRNIQRIVKSSPMMAVDAEMVPFGIFGIPRVCRQLITDSRRQWGCIIRHMVRSSFHPVGTCKMGRRNDRSTVVDTRLRVKGVKGLRVADASIMPEVTSTNPMGPTIMIGEKAADMILKDYNLLSLLSTILGKNPMF